MELKLLGKLFITAGMFLILTGLFIISDFKIPWLGKLPGDIIIHRKNFHLYFPLATCIATSVILSLLVWLLRRK